MVRIADRFRENWRGFWRRHWFLAGVFFAGVACDGASTIYFMLRTGPECEVHPAVKIASVICGPVAGPILGALGKAFFGVVVAVYLRRFAGYIFFLGGVLSFWAAWYNIWGCQMYVPLFMKWFLF